MLRECRSLWVVVLGVCIALFALGAEAQGPPKTLTVSVQGAGSVVVNPPGGAYARGTTVTLTAVPGSGWSFDHWEGPTIGGSTANPQQLTMYNNYSVVAVFVTPQGVDLIRRRDTVVKVVDGAGAPVANVEVSVNLRKRAFPFGVAVTNHLLANSRYKNFVRQRSPRFWDWAVFANEAKWSSNESVQGFVNYQDADAMLSLLTNWGFSLRGHTLFWAVPGNVQQWVQDLTTPQLQAAVDDRLLDALTHFQGAFEHWDVNNEMVHGSFFEDRIPGINKYMHDRTAELEPGALITVNDYNVIAGGWDLEAYKALVLDLEAQGVRIDILGVQCHMTTDDTVAEIQQRLDSVAELGYPIWVTEFDVVASDPLVRAQALEDFYRTAYGHPAVEGIMMWGFWAGDHWRGADAALVNLDWTLNAAGQRYADLMAEWWTDEAGMSSGAGEFGLSAFHGTYDVTLTPNGGVSEVHTVSVPPGSGVELLTLTLGSGLAADNSAPVPNPVSWDIAPTPVDDTAISMSASPASDPGGVEYYFANLTSPGHDSGWLDTPFFTDVGVTTGVAQTYQVKTRDRSVGVNESQWSASASATTSLDDNLLINGGFEYGYPDGWVQFGGASLLVSDAAAASGRFSCFVGNRSLSYKGIEQNLLGKLSPGQSYTLSASFLLANSASEPVALTIKQTDAAGTSYHTVATGTATSSAWAQISGVFTLNVVGTLSWLSVFTEGPAPGVELYVDDLSATGSSASGCGDGLCASGEDCNDCTDCPGVVGGPPRSRHCCGNGIAESAEGNGVICDGNF